MKISLLLCFMFYVFSGNLFYLNAQNTVVFDSLSKSASLKNEMFVFFDKKASLTINEVKNLNIDTAFKSKFYDIPAYSKSAVWLVVEIKNVLSEEIFLELKSSLLNHVSAYTVSDGIVVDSVNVGSVHVFADRPVKTKNFTFAIKPGQYTYYIRVKSNSYLPFFIKILDKNELYKADHFWNLVNGLLFGALILTILYNLLLYFSVRDSVYLSYSVLVFFSALTYSYHFGIGVRLLWGVYPVFSKHITILYGLVTLSAILFVVKILRLVSTMPKFYRALQIIAAFVIGIIIIDVLGFFFLSNLLLVIVFSFFYFLIFIILLQRIPNGTISTRLFFVFWLFSIIAFVLLAMQNMHVFSASLGEFDLLAYGGYVNIIMLSLVVGNKLNVYSAKNEKARFNELNALKERDHIIGMQKNELEKIVKERNKEIINKNKALLVQQKEIEYQISEIEQKNVKINEINNKLQSTNKKIEEQNFDLKGNKDELENTVQHRTKQLEKEQERAITADRLKTSFLNNLSREIKTPMNAITGYASLLLNKTISKVQINEYLHVIVDSVDSLLSLIDGIVTLSRIQAGIVKIKSRELDLKAFIKLVADEYNQKLIDSRNQNILIVEKVPEDNEYAFIKSDHQKIWLIYKQLMDNALKFTEKGTITLGYKINDEASKKLISDAGAEQKKVCEIEFFVKDTGKGMSELEVERYIMNHTTGAYNYDYKKGGLGLAIIVGLINLFNGKINVESKANKGTNISIKINAEVYSRS